MSNIQREQVRTARKAYTCEEAGPHGCRRTAQIKPGDRYAYGSGIYDGHAYSLRYCLRCSRAWKRAIQRFRFDEDNGPASGDLTGYMRAERTGRPWYVRRDYLQRAAEARAKGHAFQAARWAQCAADVRL